MQDSTHGLHYPEASEQGRRGPAGDHFLGMVAVRVPCFSTKLCWATVNRGVIQLHKNLWEAGGSETDPWLNEGKFTQLL